MSETDNSPNTAAAGADGAAPAEEKTLDKRLVEAQARIDEQKEAWMRAVAEAENVRKRAQAEISAAHKFAVERFAEGLLPVADSLEAALQSKDISGIELTHRQLKSSLEKASVIEIAPQAGERFDPNKHQAMAAVDAPGAEPNTIVAVMQKGYKLHDRVLRPALVTVSKAVEKSAGNPTSDSNLHPN
jgi:molecular chaperone GrpE